MLRRVLSKDRKQGEGPGNRLSNKKKALSKNNSQIRIRIYVYVKSTPKKHTTCSFTILLFIRKISTVYKWVLITPLISTRYITFSGTNNYTNSITYNKTVYTNVKIHRSKNVNKTNHYV